MTMCSRESLGPTLQISVITNQTVKEHLIDLRLVPAKLNAKRRIFYG